MTSTGLCYSSISSKNYRSHSTSSPTLSQDINSDFIVEHAMHVYFEDFQDPAAPPRVKIYPLVDFDSSEFTIQFASLYLSSTGGYFLYLKAYFLVIDIYSTTHSRVFQ